MIWWIYKATNCFKVMSERHSKVIAKDAMIVGGLWRCDFVYLHCNKLFQSNRSMTELCASTCLNDT